MDKKKGIWFSAPYMFYLSFKQLYVARYRKRDLDATLTATYRCAFFCLLYFLPLKWATPTIHWCATSIIPSRILTSMLVVLVWYFYGVLITSLYLYSTS